MSDGPLEYRKKPVVIEAFELTDDNVMDVIEWIWHCDGLGRSPHYVNNVGVVISTLEGNMQAEIGDFIIRGVQGEFYPCKPDIFAATYEEVEE